MEKQRYKEDMENKVREMRREILTEAIENAERNGQHMKEDYEKNTGIVIVKHFAENDINPYEIPGVIQLHHAPFTWGRSALKSLDNSIALETCAKMAIDSWKVSPELPVIPQYILDKHFLRKHGPGSYYGQRSNDQEGP